MCYCVCKLPSCICELECEQSSAVHLRCVKGQSEDLRFSAAVVCFIINSSEWFVCSAVGERGLQRAPLSVCLSASRTPVCTEMVVDL